MDTATASVGPVPGTTWLITGTASAAMTATDSTHDGVTMIGTPPTEPMGTPPEPFARRRDGRDRRGSEGGSGGTPEG